MNNKTAVWIGFLCIFAFVSVVAYLQARSVSVGAAGESVSYSAVTNSTVVCPAATSTVIVTTSTGRTSFMVSNSLGTSTVTICKAATCVSSTAGLVLGVTSSGMFSWEQTDSYIGPYSCITPNGSTTVGYSHSQ